MALLLTISYQSIMYNFTRCIFPLTLLITLSYTLISQQLKDLFTHNFPISSFITTTQYCYIGFNTSLSNFKLLLCSCRHLPNFFFLHSLINHLHYSRLIFNLVNNPHSPITMEFATCLKLWDDKFLWNYFSRVRVRLF